MLSWILLSTLCFKAERPPKLPDKPGCEHYRGTASGNDPSVQLDVVLCPSGNTLSGEVQWSSLESGWNLRRVEGTREGGRISLRDIEVTQSRPEPGWRFCEIDSYALTQTEVGLAGKYDSHACNDSATVSLERVAPPTGGTTTKEQPPDAPRPPSVVDSAPEQVNRSAPSSPEPASGGACGCASRDASHPWAALLVLLAARRRR